MAINNGVFSYGELKFINATSTDNTPDFSYGELMILYEEEAELAEDMIFIMID